MKKINLLFLLLATTLTLSAQRLGVMGGYQLTSPWPVVGGHTVDFNEKSGSGFHVGPLFEWDLTNRFGLDAAALYSLRSYTFDMHYTSDVTTHFARQTFYLDIPIHAYFRFPLGNGFQLTPFIGPSLNIALHGKDIAWLNNDLQKPVGKQTSELFGKENRMWRFQIAGEVGLALKYKNYQVRTSYSVGLNNQTIKSFDWYMGLYSNQNKYLYDGVFKLSFAYMFDLRK